MQFPHFFTLGDTKASVRIDHLFDLVFEFNIQFPNGGTDQFHYNRKADETEKSKLVQGNYDRIKAVAYFEDAWKNSDNNLQ